MITLKELEGIGPGFILRVKPEQDDIDKGVPGSSKNCAFALNGKKFEGVKECEFNSSGYFLEVFHHDGKLFRKHFIPVGYNAPKGAKQFDDDKSKVVPGIIYNFAFVEQWELDPKKEYGPEKKRVSRPHGPRKAKPQSKIKSSKPEQLDKVSFMAKRGGSGKQKKKWEELKATAKATQADLPLVKPRKKRE